MHYRILVSLVVTLYRFPEPPPPALPQMPSPWDRRYVKESDSVGWEVLLVKRLAGRGQWAGVKPDLGIGIVDLNARGHVTTMPAAGVRYLPAPVLGDAQKQLITAQVDVAVANSTLVSFGRGSARGLRDLGIVLSWFAFFGPAQIGVWIRWVTRSRYRIGFFIVSMVILNDLMDRFGVFVWCEIQLSKIMGVMDQMKQAVVDASEFWASVEETFRTYYGIIDRFIDPGRLLIYILVLIFLIYYWWSSDPIEEPASPTSSTAPSEVNSPVNSPRPGGDGEMLEMMRTMTTLTAVFQENMVKQAEERESQRMLLQEMSERIQEQNYAQQAGVMAQGAMKKERSFGSGDMDEIRKLRESLAEVRTSLSLKATAGSSAMVEVASAAVAKPATAGPTGSESRIQDIQRKINSRPTNLQEKFLELVSSLRDVEGWSSHFPENFRSRTAAEFIQEIVTEGVTLERYGREFIRTHHLEKCRPAGELIPTMIALDQILWSSGDKECLNHPHVELLCRKALGIIRAYEKCTAEEHWKQPAKAKGWSSRVDMDAARRIDPVLKEAETFRIRDLEAEVSKGMEKEALLAKVRMKLAATSKQEDE
jgi:hypothetical protein